MSDFVAAAVRPGTSTVMVSEATERYKAMRGAFYLYVENADAAMHRAIENGAVLEMDVSDMPYGDREGGVVDPGDPGIVAVVPGRGSVGDAELLNHTIRLAGAAEPGLER
jgi:hypothetical protein